MWGIKPRNKEQHFALDLLLNDDIKLVTLVGKAGTGKTLLAIAAGLQKVTEEQVFSEAARRRARSSRSAATSAILPGDIEEKLNPWMQPIYDNLELLLGLNKSDKKDGRSYAELVDLGFVEIEPLTYIRGRSLPNVYMIVDEAQNLTPHEVKTIVTRAGEGTKIILTGDPYQIDHPYVDSSNNGLTTVVERFKHEPIAGHVTLTQGRALAARRARHPDPVIARPAIAMAAALAACTAAHADDPGYELRLTSEITIAARHHRRASRWRWCRPPAGRCRPPGRCGSPSTPPTPSACRAAASPARTPPIRPPTPRASTSSSRPAPPAITPCVCEVRFWLCGQRVCRPIETTRTVVVHVPAPAAIDAAVAVDAGVDAVPTDAGRRRR